MIDPSEGTAARIAGVSLPLAFIILAVSTFAILDPIVAFDDPGEKARSILANEGRFRIAIIADLLYCIGQIAIAGALYVLVRPVDRTLALLGALLRLAWAFTWIVLAIDYFGALRYLHDPHVAGAPGEATPALLGMYLGGYDIYYVGLPFWSLAATLVAWLLYRGRLVPRGLALFGVAAAAWCVVCAFGHLIEPDFINAWIYDTPLALYELALGGWLLIKGAGRHLTRADDAVR